MKNNSVKKNPFRDTFSRPELKKKQKFNPSREYIKTAMRVYLNSGGSIKKLERDDLKNHEIIRVNFGSDLVEFLKS